MTDAIPTTVLRVNHHSAQHIAERYPYAAFGSNLWMQQMTERCPRAELATAGYLLDFRLDFAKVATITADEGSTVPVGIYQLTATDIERLDKKEGMGRVYDRYLVTAITQDSRALRCFTYIKRDGALQPPTPEYFGKLLAGYRDWRFEDRRLRHARQRAQEAWEAGAKERDKRLAESVVSQLDSVRRKYAAQAKASAWSPLGLWTKEEPDHEMVAHHMDVEWGERDKVIYWRIKGERAWYRDVSDHKDIQRGKVRGFLASELPGAYKPRGKR